MWSAFTRALDRYAIRTACRSVAAEESISRETVPKELGRIDPFADFPEPSRVVVQDGRFSLTSPFPSPWDENNRVSGRIFSVAGKAGGHRSPAVLLLHGWNGEQGYRYLFPILARRLKQLGMTAAMIELPYHASRKPRTGPFRNFLSGDLNHMMEATRQAIGDIRATLRWLAAEGHDPVGLWGVSLGGWLGGLVCSVEENLGAAALVTPVARLEQAIAELEFCRHIRSHLADYPDLAEELSLIARSPKLPPFRILLVEAVHDLFVSPESIEELWQVWNQPEVWRLRHGHISVLFSLAMDRSLRWLRRQLVGSC